MKPNRHIIRALAIIGMLIAFGVVIRASLVPPSFGKYGEYRGDHLFEERARDPVHGGVDICAECHDDKLELKSEGRHAAVPCEACHFQPYAADEKYPNAHPETSAPPDRTRRACTVCHEYLPSRPKDFPQVADFEAHISSNREKVSTEGMGQVDVSAPCINCHNPHSPKIEVEG